MTQRTVSCAEAKVAVSRRLDADLPDADLGDLDRHLAHCAACRAWREQVLFLQRSVAAGRIEPPVGQPFSSPRPARATVLLRVAIVAVAVVGLALAAPALALGRDDGLALHEAHELGSLQVGLAIGLLVAAWQPRRARGVLAVTGVAALLLAVTASDDLATGATTLAHELPHAAVVVGALLVWLLARRTPDSVPVRRVDVPVPVRTEAPVVAQRRAM